MVKIGLQIKAYFQNVEELKTSEDFTYYLKLRCNSCGEQNEKWQEINASNSIETVRSETNYLAKCKLCSRENSMDVLTDTIGRFASSLKRTNYKIYILAKYMNENEGNFKTIVVFDCRGVEPVDFDLRDGWEAKATSGKVFTEIELSEKMWADYDDRANESVEINDFEWKIIKVK